MVDTSLQKKLLGQQDSRGPVGILSRGANVYNGASMAAHSGGGSQFGRPPSVGTQQQNVQPNLRAIMQQGSESGIMDMNPKPVNLLGAIQRRLLGNKAGG